MRRGIGWAVAAQILLIVSVVMRSGEWNGRALSRRLFALHAGAAHGAAGQAQRRDPGVPLSAESRRGPWPVGQRDLPHRCLGRRRRGRQDLPGAAPGADARDMVPNCSRRCSSRASRSGAITRSKFRSARCRRPISRASCSATTRTAITICSRSRAARRRRLAMRLPLESKFRECSWKELAAADFPYETNHYYRLRVENRGPEIRAFIDDKLVLTASDDEISRAAKWAYRPTRRRGFRISA